MAKPTIVTRASKGSALTWTEGDANFTNLRDATITVSDGTSSTPIDLNGTITFAAGTGISVDETSGTITIANTQSAGATDLDGLSDVQINGSPTMGQVLTFMGTYWENQTASSVSNLNDLTDVSAATPSAGDILVYNSGTMNWVSQAPASPGIADVVDDTTPQLGGDLDVNGQSIVSVSNGNIVLAPNGTGKSKVNNINYYETPYAIGSNDSPSIDVANGNVQTVTITSGLSLPAFTNAVTGQSVTLIVSGSGTVSGTAAYKFAGGSTTLTNFSVISVFYDGTTYWASVATDFQ